MWVCLTEWKDIMMLCLFYLQVRNHSSVSIHNRLNQFFWYNEKFTSVQFRLLLDQAWLICKTVHQILSYELSGTVKHCNCLTDFSWKWKNVFPSEKEDFGTRPKVWKITIFSHELLTSNELVWTSSMVYNTEYSTVETSLL